MAVEEATGDVFVGDISAASKVYEFEEDGSYVHTYKHGFNAFIDYIHVDNSPESPNLGYLFVPAGEAVPGHAFAFKPKPVPHPPAIEAVSASGVGEREAVLRATVNPEGFATHYTFEYTTQAAFEEHGFEGGASAGEGDLAPAISGRQVSASISGLEPGTSYRFRVRATSECEPGGCGEEAEGSFSTFIAPLQGGACENAALRTGPSASLPDCRAYELVTPPDTNGQAPQALGVGGGIVSFGSPTVRADGEVIPFVLKGGALPGIDTAGSGNGDLYLATRTASGWQTASDGPTGEQGALPAPEGVSAEFEYAAWALAAGGIANTSYLRHPDGTYHLIGEGTPESDSSSRLSLKLIAPAGSHVLFVSEKQLLPGAPGAGTASVYDRTADGSLHLVSMLPGDVVPGEHEGAVFRGSSADGSAVAFNVGTGNPLYARLDDSRTVTAAPAGSEFAGFTEEGRYLFYVSQGDFFRFDIETEEAVEIAATGDALPVNVPRQGGGAYFISEAELGEGGNPLHAEPVGGQPNLYYWNGSATHFVATVTSEDVKGEALFIGSPGYYGGFREWMASKADGTYGRDGRDPVRSSLQGSTMLFRTRAQITPYDSEGHSEIYRYDAGEGTLACVSCSPTGAPAGSDAKLITYLEQGGGLGAMNQTANLSDDGARAFFETSDRLVSADNDGTQDVYEWEAEGEGSCRQAGGCVFLISSGQSGQPNYFFGASAGGNDVAISTSDLLTAADGDETASVYDARAGGGFPAAAGAAGECQGEACQPAARAPEPVTPASANFQGAGNLKQGRHACPKGTRSRRVHGKARCAKKHRKRHKHHRQGRSGR